MFDYLISKRPTLIDGTGSTGGRRADVGDYETEKSPQSAI